MSVFVCYDCTGSWIPEIGLFTYHVITFLRLRLYFVHVCFVNSHNLCDCNYFGSLNGTVDSGA